MKAIHIELYHKQQEWTGIEEKVIDVKFKEGAEMENSKEDQVSNIVIVSSYHPAK